jgi:hypothetical protein
MTIDPNTGAISTTSTPTTAGAYRLQVGVTDSAGLYAYAPLTLEVAHANGPTITTTPPAATVGSSYCVSLAATGGIPGYGSWAVTSGSLPPGLSLDGYGHLTGTPTAAGTYSFTVSVTDGVGQTASAPLSITIS